MLSLSSGANLIYPTLWENTTLAVPYYLFVFVNDHTGHKYACTATDITSNITRNNKFILTVKSSPNPLNGEINLINYGFYHYYIYEKTLAEVTSFNYAGIDSLDIRTISGQVEIGKMKYLAPDTTNAYYKDLRESVKTYGK